MSPRRQGAAPVSSAIGAVLLLAFSFVPERAFGQSAPLNTYTLSDATSLHDLFHGLTGLFGNRPFNTQAEILRLVGNDPWTLLPETEASLYTLQPRLRFVLFGLLAENYSTIYLTPMDGAPDSRFDVNPSSWEFQFNGTQPSQFITPLLNTVLTQFNDVQMVDLAVATLFKLPFMPQTDAQWHTLLNWIDRWDIPIALAVAAIGAAANAGTLQIGGQFTQLDRGAVQVGWYGGTQNLGVHLDPIIRGGATVVTRVFQMMGGLVGQVNGPTNVETLGAEVYFKQHWIEFFHRPVGWEFVCTERANATVLQQAAVGSRLSAEIDLYGRRPNIFGDSNLSFMSGLSTSSDFFSQALSTASVGFDESRFSATLAIQASVIYDAHLEHFGYRAGLFAAGTIESTLSRTSRDLVRYARRIRQLLAQAREGRASIDRLEQEERDTSRSERRDAEIRLAMRDVDARRSDLARIIQLYMDTRNAYFELQDRGPSSLTDSDGGLEPEILVSARNEAARQRL